MVGISCVKYSLGSNWKPLLVGEGPKPCETGDGYCELPRLLFQSRRWLLTPSGQTLPASLRLAQHRLTRDHGSRDLFAFTGGQHASSSIRPRCHHCPSSFNGALGLSSREGEMGEDSSPEMWILRKQGEREGEDGTNSLPLLADFLSRHESRAACDCCGKYFRG